VKSEEFNVNYSLKLIKLKQVPSLWSVGLRQISKNCLSACAPKGQGLHLAQGNALWYLFNGGFNALKGQKP
jgi:hypothetical protein